MIFNTKLPLKIMLAVKLILPGLVGLPAFADSDLPFSWIRNLNTTAWGYIEAEDPSEYGSSGVVERFELRTGDCSRNEREDDCKSDQERVELIELDQSTLPLNGEIWYRWKMYFPDDYTITYPAKTYHFRFIERGGEVNWSLEIGSTGVLWLGNYVADDATYYPLIDEGELLSQWHEFSVHVKWGSAGGFFKVWVNGKAKVDYEGPTCKDCRMRIGYGIMRSGLDKYRQAYPNNQLPTQVVYYSGLERSSSGINYPGYTPEQKASTVSPSNLPKVLKPVLIIEKNEQEALDPTEVDQSKGEAEVPTRE